MKYIKEIVAALWLIAAVLWLNIACNYILFLGNTGIIGMGPNSLDELLFIFRQEVLFSHPNYNIAPFIFPVIAAILCAARVIRLLEDYWAPSNIEVIRVYNTWEEGRESSRYI